MKIILIALTIGFPIALALLALCALFVIYPRCARKKNQKLEKFFQGKTSYPLGDFRFSCKGKQVVLYRAGQLGTNHNPSMGSYPVLWFYWDAQHPFYVAHAQAGRYWILKGKKEVLETDGITYLVGAEDEHSLSDLKNRLRMAKLDEQLFAKEFSTLTLYREWHVTSFGVKKVGVVRYYGLSESVYEHPELLMEYLNGIFSLLPKSLPHP